jgi:hypothetical protein
MTHFLEPLLRRRMGQARLFDASTGRPGNQVAISARAPLGVTAASGQSSGWSQTI